MCVCVCVLAGIRNMLIIKGRRPLVHVCVVYSEHCARRMLYDGIIEPSAMFPCNVKVIEPSAMTFETTAICRTINTYVYESHTDRLTTS